MHKLLPKYVLRDFRQGGSVSVQELAENSVLASVPCTLVLPAVRSLQNSHWKGFVQGCKVDVSWHTMQFLESCLVLCRLESRSIVPERPGRQPPDCPSKLQNTKSQHKSIANGFAALRNMSCSGVCLPDQSPLSLSLYQSCPVEQGAEHTDTEGRG